MRQVPALTSFLIIGDGRLARHLRHYFDLEEIPYIQWSRQDGASRLNALLAQSSHILLAISDSALSGFVAQHPTLAERICVHFSGSIVMDTIPSAHPLMTFAANRVYDLDTYRKIPFVLERGRASFAALLPGLTNPSFEIDADHKGRYHALCSLAGNFSVLLWEKAIREFQNELRLPKAVLIPYLRQITENLALSESGESVLTGPLVRGDQATIQKHLFELEHDAFGAVYAAFVAAYAGTRANKTGVAP